MIAFTLPARWSTAQCDAVAEYLERLFGDLCAQVPLDALLCPTCVKEQLHLALDDDVAFIDLYRRDNPEDRAACDWHPAQLTAIVSLLDAIDRDLQALYAAVVAVVAVDPEPNMTAHGVQLELHLGSAPDQRVAGSDLPF